jgi:peptidoglycan hydrolase-like protein with peptidoglycan-binding domain
VQWTATGTLGLNNQTKQYDGWVVIQREAMATQWVSFQNQGSLDDTNVQQDQTYRYRACVILSNLEPRTCSDWISAQASTGGSTGGTTSSSLVTMPAVNPNGEMATGITGTSATITWQATQGETEYEITASDDLGNVGAGSEPTTGSSKGTSYALTALQTGHTYNVEVCGKTTGGPCSNLAFQTQAVLQSQCAACRVIEATLPQSASPTPTPQATPIPVGLGSSTVLQGQCAACRVIEATLPQSPSPTTTPTATPISVGLSSSTVLQGQCAACRVIEATLPQSPSPTPTPQPPAYHDPLNVNGWPQLDLGTQGEAVKTLQYLLLAHGGSLPAFGVDGKFGSETDAAVRAFQNAQGLKVDGIVGPLTWQALIVVVQQGDKGPAVEAVQSQLKSQGVAIVVNGDFGAQTDAAVRSYQQNHGVTADGIVSPQVWQSLLTRK